MIINKKIRTSEYYITFLASLFHWMPLNSTTCTFNFRTDRQKIYEVSRSSISSGSSSSSSSSSECVCYCKYNYINQEITTIQYKDKKRFKLGGGLCLLCQAEQYSQFNRPSVSLKKRVNYISNSNATSHPTGGSLTTLTWPGATTVGDEGSSDFCCDI